MMHNHTKDLICAVWICAKCGHCFNICFNNLHMLNYFFMLSLQMHFKSLFLNLGNIVISTSPVFWNKGGALPSQQAAPG